MSHKLRALPMALLLAGGMTLFPTPAHAVPGLLIINGERIIDPPDGSCHVRTPPLTVYHELGGSYKRVTVHSVPNCRETVGGLSRGQRYTFPDYVVAVKVHF
ncbi:hypothetical protein [Streptosporangium sp. KLBMP 9127]|nr:hypothetical protein [Streptosporangium sp. KLBMP 9127]